MCQSGFFFCLKSVVFNRLSEALAGTRAMPLVKALHQGSLGASEEETLKKQLLDKLSAAAPGNNGFSSQDRDLLLEDDDSINLSDVEDEPRTSEDISQVYHQLEEQSKDIPLQKVIFSPEGISLFDELCLRVDVNQR